MIKAWTGLRVGLDWLEDRIEVIETRKIKMKLGQEFFKKAFCQEILGGESDL